MLANSAATLPTGHALMETYAFNQIQGDSRLFGSLTYLLYGATDRLTVGVKPMFGVASSGGKRSRPGVGDLTLSGQIRLTPRGAPPGHPTISLSLQHSFPTGRHDRLSGYRRAALGSGAHGTTLALYGQQYFWLPNGRIFRARLNLSGSRSSTAKVVGESVYGTSEGFRGSARPGAILTAGVSGEYSLTREWVLALDVVMTHARPTGVSGHLGTSAMAIAFRSPAVDTIAIAPAIEYSWRSDFGVFVGMRVVPKWGGSAASVTPAVAINYVI